MLNLQLGPNDHQGDMAPNAASPHRSPDGVASIPLYAGDALYSPGGGFRFVLQGTDKNAIVEVVDDSTLPAWKQGEPLQPDSLRWLPLWNAGTQDKGVIELDMQSDGNLVVYNGSGAIPLSYTAGNPGAFLRMQDDGNLVIYSSSGAPLWQSRTNAQLH